MEVDMRALVTGGAEARETLADISKVTDTLGWIPKVDLKEWINAD